MSTSINTAFVKQFEREVHESQLSKSLYYRLCSGLSSITGATVVRKTARSPPILRITSSKLPAIMRARSICACLKAGSQAIYSGSKPSSMSRRSKPKLYTQKNAFKRIT